MSKLLNEKINLKDYKTYITLLIFVLSGIFNFLYVNNLMRLLTMSIIVFFGSYFLFKKNVKLTLLCTVFEQIIVVISEMILTIFSIFILNINYIEINKNFLGNFFYVLVISLFMILIINLKITAKLYKIFFNKTEKIKFENLGIYSILIIISVNFFIVSNFLELTFQKVFLINIIFMIIYLIILLFAIYNQNEKIEFKQKNQILINTLNEYEKMLDYQRIDNHENKNQLLVIKSMVQKGNKKVIEYLDEIIKEKREDNEVIYSKAKMIPSGGLQGLIYQKMLLMQENNINVILNVSNNMRKIDLTNISSKINYDICRIVGIILDNAIDEILKFDKKNREIIISMYIENYFFIEISNRIKNQIDINKITEKGYTTKENGHGYGLCLLNKIIEKNDKISNKTRIVNNIFTQIIKIEI